MSYCHKQSELVATLRTRLGSFSYSIWIDKENPANAGQSIYEWMAEGIDKSKSLMSCMSLDYEKSANCQRELVYATELKKPIFFIRADKGYKAEHWLRLIMGGAQYHDLTGDNKEEAWNYLTMQLKKEFGTRISARRMKLSF